MTTPKINLTELLADREAGTVTCPVCNGGRQLPDYADLEDGGFIDCYECDGAGAIHTMRRRIARLPALEAAYIEAVRLLLDVLPDLNSVPHSSGIESDIRKFLGDEK